MDNLAPIVEPSDIPTKQAVDSKVAKTGDTMTGPLNVQGIEVKDFGNSYSGVVTPAFELSGYNSAIDDKSVFLISKGAAGLIYLRPNNDPADQVVVDGTQLLLPRDPSAPMHAATRNYVDGLLAGGDEVWVGPDEPAGAYELWYDTDAPDSVGLQGPPGPPGPPGPVGISADAGNAIRAGTDGLVYTTPPLLVLGPSDPIPPTTAVGTVIVRMQ